MGSSVPPAALPDRIVLFPFMSKGHTIPLLDLARLLLLRCSTITVTVFTTTANYPFIAQSLAGTAASIVTIPFAHDVPDIPPGTESTDQLPSMSLFPAFATATPLMQPHFEAALEKLLPVRFIVSDGFLWWTLESANRFGVPRFVFYGMGIFALAMYRAAAVESQLLFSESYEDDDDDDTMVVPSFPTVKIRRSDFDFPNPESNRLLFDFNIKCIESVVNSRGILVNSFEELEPAGLDYWNRTTKPRALCIGPLCPVEPPEEPGRSKCNIDSKTSSWVDWLDQKRDRGISVLYVAFGSQADISTQQLKEIAAGLEKSGAHFLWILKAKDSDLGEEFERRVEGRGLMVKSWVDQRSILMHPSVQGFLSHCGWNSVIESVCAGVPILAWPMMAEQPLNAKLVAEMLKVGLRVGGPSMKMNEFVNSETLERNVRELMEGEEGKAAKKKAGEAAEVARRAVRDGGSSWRTLWSILTETCNKNTS